LRRGGGNGNRRNRSVNGNSITKAVRLAADRRPAQEGSGRPEGRTSHVPPPRLAVKFLVQQEEMQRFSEQAMSGRKRPRQ
jgi:hypothetical protein